MGDVVDEGRHWVMLLSARLAALCPMTAGLASLTRIFPVSRSCISPFF